MTALLLLTLAALGGWQTQLETATRDFAALSPAPAYQEVAIVRSSGMIQRGLLPAAAAEIVERRAIEALMVPYHSGGTIYLRIPATLTPRSQSAEAEAVARSGGAVSVMLPPPLIPPPQVYETEWQSVGGVQILKTPKDPRESYSNHAWRHGGYVASAGKINTPLMPSADAGDAVGSLPGSTGTSTMTTEWTSNGGMFRHRVSTPPHPGEPLAEQAARHKQAVNALESVFPPDPKVGLLWLAPQRVAA